MKKSNFEHWQEANQEAEEYMWGRKAAMWIGLVIILAWPIISLGV